MITGLLSGLLAAALLTAHQNWEAVKFERN